MQICFFNPYLGLQICFLSQSLGLHICFLYTPFTLDDNSRAIARDSRNRHLSLVVAPSPPVVATVRCTLSKRHEYFFFFFHFTHQMNCRPVVGNIWDTVEKQSCTSRMTNLLQQHSVMWQMYLNYVWTMSRQWGDKCWGTVEKQSCMSRTTNMQNTLWQRSVTWWMYLNYLSTISQPWGDKWRL